MEDFKDRCNKAKKVWANQNCEGQTENEKDNNVTKRIEMLEGNKPHDNEP